MTFSFSDVGRGGGVWEWGFWDVGFVVNARDSLFFWFLWKDWIMAFLGWQVGGLDRAGLDYVHDSMN